MTAMFTYVHAINLDLPYPSHKSIHPPIHRPPEGHPPDFFSGTSDCAECMMQHQHQTIFGILTNHDPFLPCSSENPRAVCTNSEAVPLRYAPGWSSAGGTETLAPPGSLIQPASSHLPVDRGRLIDRPRQSSSRGLLRIVRGSGKNTAHGHFARQ